MTSPDVRFTFDDRPLTAPAGASVASALLANGIRSWRRTRRMNAARGLLCGIGTCFDCLVDVGADHAVRACVTALRDGDAVRTSASRGMAGAELHAGHATSPARDAGDALRRDVAPTGAAPAGAAPADAAPADAAPADAPPADAASADIVRADVLVVGGGPAGLAAADAAVDGGVSVVLVNDAARLGGQLLRQPSDGTDGPAPPLSPWLAARYPGLAGAPGSTITTGVGIWQLRAGRGGVVAWLEDGRRIEATAVVLAPGATELLCPFPGWELPGVVSAGAAQSLLKAHGQLIGRRVLVAGSGPFLFPVAAHLAEAGAEVVALVEALGALRLAPTVGALAGHPTKAAEAATYAATLLRRGVPVRTGRVVARCEAGPDGSVCRAVVVPTEQVRGADRRDGRRARIYDVDAVCISYGFVPRLELARQLGLAEEVRPGQPFPSVRCDATQATSLLGVFAAGEVTGIAGGEAAALEGAVAGASAAAHCVGRDRRAGAADRDAAVGGGGVTGRDASKDRRRIRARRFADRLVHVYRTAVPLGTIGDETVVCRCEDVRAAAIRSALDAGAVTAKEVRDATRCGMGYCQGRTCGPLVQLLLAEVLGTAPSRVGDLQKRPVVTPVSLGVVARGAGPTS